MRHGWAVDFLHEKDILGPRLRQPGAIHPDGLRMENLSSGRDDGLADGRVKWLFKAGQDTPTEDRASGEHRLAFSSRIRTDVWYRYQRVGPSHPRLQHVQDHS